MKTIENNTYSVAYSELFKQFRIQVKGVKNLYYWFSPLSIINTITKKDITTEFPEIKIIFKKKKAFKIALIFSSSIWKKKIVYFIFTKDKIETFVQIEGNGILDRIYFGMGNIKNEIIGSIPGFDYFIPGCTNFLTKKDFFVNEYFGIGIANETTHWGLSLNSGPLLYMFGRRNEKQHIWAGLFATKIEHQFNSFDFNYKPDDVLKAHDNIVNTQSFSVAYNGAVKVVDSWESPHLVFGFGKEKLNCIKNYCTELENRKLIPKFTENSMPKWWSKPIYCGWHDQVALGLQKSQNKPLSQEELESMSITMDECTQENHQRWLKILLDKKIPIGTIIIDAKWQKEFALFDINTHKWPDMRGFIDECHRHGIRVLLWLQAWSKEGLVPKECILENAIPVAMDPTSPSYQKKLQKGIHHMLSEQKNCLNADGFKIDGTSAIPVGRNIKTYQNIYGFALQHYYIDFIYKTAKNIKADSLISLFIANPLFRDISDMVRLGDLYTVYGSVNDTMHDRADIIRAAMRGKLIDTDGAFQFSMQEDYIQELESQLLIGVPTLYQIEWVYQHRTFIRPALRKFKNIDYKRICKLLNKYSKDKK